MINRTAINPVSWSINLGFDQAELVEGHRRQLFCSGQDAVLDGTPQHPGDVAAQLTMALDNVEATLAAAGMTLANVVRLNAYATDMGQLLNHWQIVTERFVNAGGRFATSLLGIGQLPAPELLVMLEATALD